MENIKYLVNDREVSKLEFDTSISEAITDYIYHTLGDNRDPFEYDDGIDILYKDVMAILNSGRAYSLDGYSFKIIKGEGK